MIVYNCFKYLVRVSINGTINAGPGNVVHLYYLCIV